MPQRPPILAAVAALLTLHAQNALAQHTHPEDLIDWNLETGPLHETTADQLDRHLRASGAPARGAHGSGWQAVRLVLANKDNPHNALEQPVNRLLNARNFLPPRGVNPNAQELEQDITNAANLATDWFRRDLGIALSTNQWDRVVAATFHAHDLAIATLERLPHPVSINNFTPASASPPSLRSALSRHTTTILDTINNALDNNTLPPEAPERILRSLAYSDRTLNDTFFAHLERLRPVLHNQLLTARTELGIDTPDKPGHATGPTPLDGADTLIDRIKAPPGIHLRAVPNAAELSRLLELVSPRGMLHLDDAIAIIREHQQPLDAPNTGISYASLAARKHLANAKADYTTELKRAATILRLAAHAHHQTHGNFPVTEQDIDPELQPFIPQDPLASTRTLRFQLLHPTKPLYAIYSIATDNHDDQIPHPPSSILANPTNIRLKDPLTHQGDPAGLRPNHNPQNAHDLILHLPPTQTLRDLQPELLFTPAFLTTTAPGNKKPGP